MVEVLPCSRCKNDKPIEAFRRRKQRPETGKRLGRWSWCKECEAESFQTPERRAQGNKRSRVFRKRMKENNPAEAKRRERESNLKRNYGFGEEQYNAMLLAHGGVCCICGKPPTKGRGKRLNVDHDHETGRIRGLLCVMCNISLGGFNDNPTLLRKAAEYIESFTQPAS